MKPGSTRPKFRWTIPFFINIAIIIISIGCTFYLVASILSNPFSAGRAFLFFLMFVPIVIGVNRIFAVIQKYIVVKKFPLLIRICTWILTFIIPFLILSFASETANDRAMRIVENKLSSLISHIESVLKEKGELPDDIFSELKNISEFQNNLLYYRGASHYLIETRGGSIDIDGSTIFYHSPTKRWYRIQNDIIHYANGNEKAEIYRKATKGVKGEMYKYNIQGKIWEYKDKRRLYIKRQI